MNITIRPGAATDDASQIDSIINSIRTSMEELNRIITSTIPSGIETDWSEEVLSNWNTYYGADVPAALEEMELSATNLRLAVEESLRYSKGE